MNLPLSDPLPLRTTAALAEIGCALSELPDQPLSSFDPTKTVLVLMDMINGFAVAGILASPRIGALIDPIARLAAACDAVKMPILAFADAHTPDSLELKSYPPHCMRGSEASQVCDAIAAAASFDIIEKNSTNGFVEPAFDSWRNAHPAINTYILVGDCTDICVSQFALTAKAYFNTRDLPSRIVVPTSLVDTFDGDGHDADLCNLLALYSMRQNGVELCRSLLLEG